jgi:hypothetical protein
MRVFISLAALLVNERHKMASGATPSSMAFAARKVTTVVLPVPTGHDKQVLENGSDGVLLFWV